MQAEAVFENIGERILHELNKVQKSVFIAVSSFTNKILINALLNKARSECSVSILMVTNENSTQSTLDFAQLIAAKAQVYKMEKGDTSFDKIKFCVIDQSTVITGSYQWGYQTKESTEYINITYNDATLAEQYIAEFYTFRALYYPDEIKVEMDFPWHKIIKRLEIIKNYILLEDTDELQKEVEKLSVYTSNRILSEIIMDLRNKFYANAILKMQDFISENQALTLWIDPEIAALKLEIKELENQLNSYDHERIEIEKKMFEFQHRHTLELGEIILNLLTLRRIKYKSDKEKFEDASKDESDYRAQFEAEKRKEIFDLSEQEKTEIKKKFRKATNLCHPDKVSDEFKEAAQKIFVSLKQAYDRNDLHKVSTILDDLEKYNYFKSASESITEKELLKSSIAKLQQQIKSLASEISTSKQSEAFNSMMEISNWDEYFQKTKEKLKMELEELQMQIEG